MSLTATLGNDFVEALGNTPGLTPWVNTLQYAWQAHVR